MSHHRARHGRRSDVWQATAFAAVAVLLFGGLLAWGASGGEGGSAGLAPVSGALTVTSTPDPVLLQKSRPTESVGPEAPAQPVRPGRRIEPLPQGPEILDESRPGGVGTGLVHGPLTSVDSPVGIPVSGTVTTSVANLPNRTSAGGFASSIRTLTADGQDFVILNEVSKRSLDGLRAMAPGYDAYRDPTPDRSRGGVQSMNNVVMWRSDRWLLADAGRVKLVDDDTGFHGGKPFTWDRYATWVTVQRQDGAVMSVVSTHMMTNPAKFPRQHGSPSMSRVERYARGMDVLRATVAVLAERGPVLVGGDMNSHAGQGSWTAAAKMGAVGYPHVKDKGVMYLFYPQGATVAAHRQVRVASDHPAIVTTLDMNGLAPPEAWQPR